jgi:hypothetical protein
MKATRKTIFCFHYLLQHGSGFLMASTSVQFPLNPSGEIVQYNYTVDYSPMKGRDVLGEFVSSCEKRKIRTGFYYSVVSNNYLNVQSGFVSYAIFSFFPKLTFISYIY